MKRCKSNLYMLQVVGKCLGHDDDDDDDELCESPRNVTSDERGEFGL